MATTIKIRNSATPGATPSSLKQGEFAINVADGRLFYGSGSADAVKEFTGIDTGSFIGTGSFNAFTSSIQTAIDNLTAKTGSYATTGSNQFNGNQTLNGILTITGSEQCNLHMYSTVAGGGISLRDNTTTDDDQVGIGAFGDNLCFRAGGAPAGNMRLLDNGNLGIGNLNPPEKLTVEGNISGSQTGSFAYLNLPGFDFDSNAPSTALEVQGPITASAITSSGQIYGQVGVNEYNTSNLPASNTYSGDVIKLLSVSVSLQRVHYLNNTTWALAQSNAESTSDNMLAIAIGSNSDQGMLLRGLYRFTYNPGGNPGDPLYLSLTGGTVTSTAPSGTGEVVRIIGYKVDTNTIYFNPSNDYIVLA